MGKEIKNFGLFKAMCFGIVLLLGGCAEIRDKTALQVTTYEALNMKLDTTTKDQAEDILRFNGYLVEDKSSNIQEELKYMGNQKLPNEIKNFVGPMLEKQSTIKAFPYADEEWMEFIFDKDQKLIGFIAQGRKNILDPLIARINSETRDILFDWSSHSLLKHEKLKAAIEKEGHWDATVYLGKDLSFAINVHTEKMKDMAIYAVTSPGCIQQLILMRRDYFKHQKSYENLR